MQQAPTTSEVVLATAGYDHTIRFWEALSGICIRTIQHPDSQVNRLAISPDKRFLAAAGNPHVRLFEVQTNNPSPVCTTPGIQRDYELKSPVTDVIIHPNQGELISCDQSGAIKIWDLGENSCTHELVPEEDTPLRSITMASDGSVLIAANNKGNYFVWKTKRGEMTDLEAVQKVQAHGKYITKCLLSPDTRILATCSADHTVKIWNSNIDPDADEYSSLLDPKMGCFMLDKTLTGHQRWVWDCAFSADSAYLVTGSSDHSARLWDLSNADTIRHYNGHQKAVVCVALHDVSL
ncbi:TOR complex subunit lst8 [Nowakowskiella sp. JEL0078]|nr:TOR complex subunit lst8 [Nowakowskiella sp. JEL0078]